MEVVECFPNFFYIEEGKEVARPITLNDILSVLKGFEKDKILGLDGWTV